MVYFKIVKIPFSQPVNILSLDEKDGINQLYEQYKI